MALIIERLAGLISPVLCHMAEDIWQNLPYPVAENSVFQRGWPTVPDAWRNETLSAPVQELRDLRAAVNKVLEDCRSRQELGELPWRRLCASRPAGLSCSQPSPGSTTTAIQRWMACATGCWCRSCSWVVNPGLNFLPARMTR